jgi:hypothetical protein
LRCPFFRKRNSFLGQFSIRGRSMEYENCSADLSSCNCYKNIPFASSIPKYRGFAIG